MTELLLYIELFSLKVSFVPKLNDLVKKLLMQLLEYHVFSIL